jgi:hypothetical protein
MDMPPMQLDAALLEECNRGSANTSVDRRLVTNVLLTFLCTPQEDTKRFEMLGLLASILSWSDEERVRAGLRRIGNNPGVIGLIW